MSKRFKTQDYAKFKKLGIRWRKPSGRQSKLRVKKTGSGMLVKVGYRTAKSIRGKIRQNTNKMGYDSGSEGYMDAPVISNISGLAGKKAVIISSSVGLKKAKAILEKAADLGIKVLNGRRVKDGLKSREEKIKKAATPEEEKKEVTEKISDTKIEKKIEKSEQPKEGTVEVKEEKVSPSQPTEM